MEILTRKEGKIPHLSGVFPQLLLCLHHSVDGILQLILGLLAHLQGARRGLRCWHPERKMVKNAELE